MVTSNTFVVVAQDKNNCIFLCNKESLNKIEQSEIVRNYDVILMPIIIRNGN